MTEKSSRKEVFNFYNSLIGLVKVLEGRCTVIDLRNECIVTGLIFKVDGNMNVEMKNAVFYDARGIEHKFRDFYVSSRNIRYVHIPEDLSIRELFDSQIGNLSKGPANRKNNKQRTFKQRRAEKYNQSTIQEAYNQPGPSSHS